MNKRWVQVAGDWKCNSRPGLSDRIQMPAGHAKRVYSVMKRERQHEVSGLLLKRECD